MARALRIDDHGCGNVEVLGVADAILIETHVDATDGEVGIAFAEPTAYIVLTQTQWAELAASVANAHRILEAAS